MAAGVVQDYLLVYHMEVCITYNFEFRDCGGRCSSELPSGVSMEVCITYICEFRGCGGRCSSGLPSGIPYGGLCNL